MKPRRPSGVVAPRTAAPFVVAPGVVAPRVVAPRVVAPDVVTPFVAAPFVAAPGVATSRLRSERARAPFGRRVYGLVIVLAVVFGMGPTVGDIGSCGQRVDPLDPAIFFEIKATVDCRRCGECGLGGAACSAACAYAIPTAFARGCKPVVHDGEVCLHALLHASCDDYALYVDEARPSAPSECQFCPLP